MEFRDLDTHVRKMPLAEIANLRAIILHASRKVEERPHVRQWKPQIPAPPNKAQLRDGVLAVDTSAVFSTRRPRHDPVALIESDRFNTDPALAGGFSNRDHVNFLRLIL